MSRDRERTGYAQPPRQSQFKPGQSGNPAGRPRKVKAAPTALPKLEPTRTLIAREAARLVTVRNGDERSEVTSTEAVLRAMAMKAMQGGILAARTYIQLNMAEDERQHAKRRERFDFWANYVDAERAKIAVAERRGEPAPPSLPHPDDIELDYITLEVKFTGPVDEETQGRILRRKARSDLYFELMVFCGETKNPLPTQDAQIVGPYTLLYLIQLTTLPPRIRELSDEVFEAIEQRIRGRRDIWHGDLEQRCAELNVPFDPGSTQTACVDLRDLGYEFVNGEFVESRRRK
jgi:hypothetical protein